jgi:hypothetical protein
MKTDKQMTGALEESERRILREIAHAIIDNYLSVRPQKPRAKFLPVTWMKTFTINNKKMDGTIWIPSPN